MAILYDARGNPINVGFPDGVTNETITDARPITAVLGSLNAEAVIDLNGAAVVTVDGRTGAGALTYLAEGTIDGVNYMALPMFANFQLLVAAAVAEQYVGSVVIATTHSGIYTIGCSGFRRVRIRVSAYTSGNVTVGLRASPADFIIYGRPIPSILHVTATAASGSAATASLPAAAGLFHYITKIHLVQFVVAARTAAATPVLATTTNLPGSPIYSCDATVGAVGQIFLYDFEPITPLKSSVVNTATTFVGPATTSTIWRWNISYFLGA